jgi:long-chain fatty acid transport protein
MNRTALLAMLVLPTLAHAAGFQLGEEGAAATGMSGAFTAKADDATAIFYNPAGIAKLRGLQVYAGGMVILGRSRASSTEAFTIPGGSQDSNWSASFIPNVYASYGFTHDVAVGVGLFTNFGLQAIWPQEWAGRFVASYTKLEDFTINPCIAWRPVSWFSIGAGLDVTPARLQLRRSEDLVDAEALVRFVGNGVGVGGNVSVLFESPRAGRLPPFTLGVSYRSRYNLDFDSAVLTPSFVPLELSAVLHDSDATTTIRIPDLVSVGVGVRPVEALFLQVQFDWTGWSRFSDLQLKAHDPALNLVVPEAWKNSYTLRIGGEYVVGKVSARLGFGFDWTPAPEITLSPAIPDAQRYLVSGGVGVHLPKGFTVEGALMGVIFSGRTSTLPELPVHYDTWAVLFSFAASYHHPKPQRSVGE